MTIKEAAEKWGVNDTTIKRWMAEGSISYTTNGRNYILDDNAQRPSKSMGRPQKWNGARAVGMSVPNTMVDEINQMIKERYGK